MNLHVPRLLTAALQRLPADSLWRARDFRRLFLATFLTVLGTAVSQMALPLTAVQVLGASASDMGILAACQLLPFATVGLPGGVWIDRSSKRRVAILFDIFAAAGLALVPLAALADMLSMPLLYAVGFMVSTTEAIGGSALQGFVTRLVGRERLVAAHSKLSAASSIALVGGPALAAALIAWVGAPLAVTLDALSFVVSACLLARIRYREQPGQPEPAALVAQIQEGLRLVWQTPMLRAVLLVVALWVILSDSFKALYVLRASRDLALGAGDIALINTLGALGALTAAPIARLLGERRSVRDAMALGIALAGCGHVLYLLPAAGQAHAAWFLGAALWVTDCGTAIYVINYLTLRQAVTPDALLGRMVTSMRFLSILPAPLGTVMMGRAADVFGLVATFAVTGLGLLVIGLLAFLLLPAMPGSGQVTRHP